MHAKLSIATTLRTVIFVLVGAMWAVNAVAAEVAGKVQFVIGEVIAIADGDSRQLKKLDPIYQADTIETGEKASAQLMMVDNARIAVRPNSAFIVQQYEYQEGGGDDGNASILSVLKGGFRTLSGKIGEEAKENYLVKTPSGTIGLRGTDHAVFHIPSGKESSYGNGKAGTYSKVYKGAVFLESEGKIIEITPSSKVGFATPGKAPQYVGEIPETAEGPVVLTPADESEFESTEADAEAAAVAPNNETESESEAEAAEIVAEESTDEIPTAEAETIETAAAPTPPTEETADLNSTAESPAPAEIPADIVADAIQRETEETIAEDAVENSIPPPTPPTPPLPQIAVHLGSGEVSERVNEDTAFQFVWPFDPVDQEYLSTRRFVRFRITGADADEFRIVHLPEHGGDISCITAAAECTLVFDAGDDVIAFRLIPSDDDIAEGIENWGIELINTDEVQLSARGPLTQEGNRIAFQVFDDEPVFRFINSDFRETTEGVAFELSVDTELPGRESTTPDQIHFRIENANRNEIQLPDGVTYDASTQLYTATIPAGQRRFTFALTPLYDQERDAGNWRVVFVDDESYTIQSDVRRTFDIFILDAVAQVDISPIAQTQFNEGMPVQLRINSDQMSLDGGLQVQFRINGADRNDLASLPAGVTYDAATQIYTATIPAGQQQFIFDLTTLTDTDAATGNEEWTVMLITPANRLYEGDSEVAFTVVDVVQVVDPIDEDDMDEDTDDNTDTGMPDDNTEMPPETPIIPADFSAGFTTAFPADTLMNPSDWIINNFALTQSDINVFGVDGFIMGTVPSSNAHLEFKNGGRVFYRTDSDGRFSGGQLTTSGQGAQDYFHFSYTLESGDKTHLTNYEVETRFSVTGRTGVGTLGQDHRESITEEVWQFGTTERTELNKEETFFKVEGTVENLQRHAEYGRPSVPNEAGSAFTPASLRYDIGGDASFGSDNAKIFSRFDVKVTDDDRCRSGSTGCYDDRLVGKFEVDAKP